MVAKEAPTSSSTKQLAGLGRAVGIWSRASGKLFSMEERIKAQACASPAESTRTAGSKLYPIRIGISLFVFAFTPGLADATKRETSVVEALEAPPGICI